MSKKVVHLREEVTTENTHFQYRLNTKVESLEEDGWELVETDLSSYYDSESNQPHSIALLTFEK